jgi:hypothetical protein
MKQPVCLDLECSHKQELSFITFHRHPSFENSTPGELFCLFAMGLVNLCNGCFDFLGFTPKLLVFCMFCSGKHLDILIISIELFVLSFHY